MTDNNLTWLYLVSVIIHHYTLLHNLVIITCIIGVGIAVFMVTAVVVYIYLHILSSCAMVFIFTMLLMLLYLQDIMLQPIFNLMVVTCYHSYLALVANSTMVATSIATMVVRYLNHCTISYTSCNLFYNFSIIHTLIHYH